MSFRVFFLYYLRSIFLVALSLSLTPWTEKAIVSLCGIDSAVILAFKTHTDGTSQVLRPFKALESK